MHISKDSPQCTLGTWTLGPLFIEKKKTLLEDLEESYQNKDIFVIE